ncbi:uncharacterized protein LOC105182208 isoform X2 [Harpegnathos saltator]|uniref:uncharacterized protein LOC105182208 isoform X2 n=1 Tax=Harpegnathos saltator TaxID=610380 RepID=UPI00058E3078|nr:uncharacterized protein LOC105182208 isoform X2 [Harpegnathos saltator]
MITNNNEPKEAEVVETEVAKGEQNEVLEEHPKIREKIKKKRRPKLMPKTLPVPKVPAKRISPRFEELARPAIHNVLFTLRHKAWILPPTLVDNLTKIVEVKTCISPEEAARVLRQKKRKTKKITQLPPLAKKWAKEIAKLDTVQIPSTLDKDMAICQYVLAVNFVKSILERQCQTHRKDLREIARVILKRLMSINEYTNTRNNDDRTTQQLHLLAEIIACWIAEVLVEVAEADKETLEKYYKKREMKETEVDDDEETDSEEDYLNQMEQKKYEKKSEDEVMEREKKDKKEDVEDEKVKQEQKTEEYMEKNDKDEIPDEVVPDETIETEE